MSISIGICLALCCLFIGLHAHVLHLNLPNRAGPRQSRNIPPRCVQNSVTPVSCAHVALPDDLLPHPDDCQLFYYCEQPYLPPVCRQCPAKLHFDPKYHVCDWPDRAGCLISNSTTTPVITTPSPTTTTPSNTTTTSVLTTLTPTLTTITPLNTTTPVPTTPIPTTTTPVPTTPRPTTTTPSPTSTTPVPTTPRPTTTTPSPTSTTRLPRNPPSKTAVDPQ